MRATPSFPLSLKVSLWLLLNLCLLAAIGIGMLLLTGTRGDTILNGPAGRRLHALTDVIVAELRAGGASEWESVLKRHATSLGVDIALFRMGGQRIAGSAFALPSDLKDFLAAGPLGLPPRSSEGDRGMRGPRLQPPLASNPEARFEGPPPPLTSGIVDHRLEGASRPPVGEESFRLGDKRPPPGLQGGLPTPRFLRHTSDPSTWWVIMPVPRIVAGPGTCLVVRLPSLLSLARLLDLHIGLMITLAAVVLSVVFWLPLVRSITRSLGQLTRATEHFAQGRFDLRVDESRRDEIGRLGRAVNRMAGQLDHLVTGQQRFLGDVAHELNSPLGRMQVAVSILEERVPEELRPAVADVREEVQLMATLVHELLDYSREQWQARAAVLSAVDLGGVCLSMLDREDPLGRVTLNMPEGLCVRAEPVLLGRALGNLVRNALRYAGHAGPVTIGARRVGAEVEIAVEDEGPGVIPSMLPHLGEPFFRGEFARTRESGGAGLGLAIVVRCARACEGSVQFANRSPKGFVATLRLAAVAG